MLGALDAERLREIIDNFFPEPAEPVIEAASNCLPPYKDHHRLASSAVATALLIMRDLAQHHRDRIGEISNVALALMRLALARHAEAQLRPGARSVH
jgi:hypothetical protein